MRSTSLLLVPAMASTTRALAEFPVGAPVPAPVAKRVDKVVTLHGEARSDPYFWLRDKPNPEVAAYLEAENAYTAAVMKPTEPFQDALYSEMLSHVKETDLSVPYREGGWLYYFRTEKGKQYRIYCRKKFPDGPEQVTPRPERAREGPEVHGARTVRRERRRKPPRVLDGQHGLPAVHALREGPARERPLARPHRKDDERRVGGGQRDAPLRGRG